MKGADRMKMTKTSAILPIIDSGKIGGFIRKSNQRRLSEEFLNKCQKSASLFKKKYNE